MSDRAEFLLSLLALPLPALLEQDPAGEQLARGAEFGAVLAAYLEGRCGRAAVLRAAAAYRLGRALPEDIRDAVRAAG